jgi:hypothetical protein
MEGVKGKHRPSTHLILEMPMEKRKGVQQKTIAFGPGVLIPGGIRDDD